MKSVIESIIKFVSGVRDVRNAFALERGERYDRRSLQECALDPYALHAMWFLPPWAERAAKADRSWWAMAGSCRPRVLPIPSTYGNRPGGGLPLLTGLLIGTVVMIVVFLLV